MPVRRGSGHRIRHCLDCHTDNFDPPHVDVLAQTVGSEYFDA